VRTAEDVLKMAQAGANRIGASASVAIVTGSGGAGGSDAASAKTKGY
jgi:deoxyribose-phosphate aldolase